MGAVTKYYSARRLLRAGGELVHSYRSRQPFLVSARVAASGDGESRVDGVQCGGRAFGSGGPLLAGGFPFYSCSRFDAARGSGLGSLNGSLWVSFTLRHLYRGNALFSTSAGSVAGKNPSGGLHREIKNEKPEKD